MSHRFPFAGTLYLELQDGTQIPLAKAQALVVQPDALELEEPELLGLDLAPAPAPAEEGDVFGEFPLSELASGEDPAGGVLVLDDRPAGELVVTTPEELAKEPTSRQRSAGAKRAEARVKRGVPKDDGPSRGVAKRVKQQGRKACGKCHELNPPRCRECQSCGAAFPAKS